MKLFLTASLLIIASASSDTATQTDWSGGPGVEGPVTNWGSNFWLEGEISWSASPGLIALDTAMVWNPFSWGMGPFNSMDLMDMDGDGDADVIASSATQGIWAYENDFLGIVWQGLPVTYMTTSIPCVRAGDINGDGDMDVVGALSGMGDILWWENADGEGWVWTLGTIEADFPGVRSLLCVDIDGDGDLDVVAAATYASGIRWWENSDGQGGAWIEHSVIEGFDGAASISSIDMDVDGDPDVIGAALYDDEVSWWENLDGQGMSWTRHIVDADYDAAWPVGAIDIDGDGDIDVLGSSFGLNEVTWWEDVDGTGTIWAGHTIDGAYSARSLCPGDIDGDGDSDVLAGGDMEYPLTWWENLDGTGTAWSEHVFGLTQVSNQSVAMADFNLDGRLDAAATSTYSGSSGGMEWWNFNGYEDEGILESSILYAGCDPDWGTLNWSSQTGYANQVVFQLRASDDCTQMGEWSDTLIAPCSLHGLLADNASYIQYRAILETALPDSTPALLDVTITWDPLGTGGSGGPEGFFLSPIAPNPSGPISSISFGLPEAGQTEISVFDISGRLVQEIGSTEYPAGNHTIQLQALGPGIYFVRMQAGEFAATQRFVVVE